MISKEVQALITYRLEQADEALQAGKLLLEAKMCRQSVSRAYYAMFYSVLALLAFRSLGTSKHSGVLAIFDREFVKEGIFEKERSKEFHELFDLRQRADYREMFEVSRERAEEALAAADRFISQIRQFLK
jgi:uncharacterized protein (UPF0332 family)